MFTNDAVRVKHILDAAQEAVSICRGRSRKELDTNRMLNLSLVRLLEIVGEAAAGISDDLKEAHPNLPWQQMTATRNRLIHGYFDVNLDVVWQTVQSDLPALIEQIKTITPADQ
jgi:uncharacterized protein with HEPN domain